VDVPNQGLNSNINYLSL